MTVAIRATLLVERIAEAIAFVLHWIGMGLLLPLLMILVTTDVVFRYVLNGSIQGATEIGQLLLLLVFFASLPYCTFRHGHVYMELLYTRFTGVRKRFADGVTALAGLVFAAAFTWRYIAVTADMRRFGEGGEMIDIPFWPFAAALVVCGGVLTLAFAVQCARVAFGMDIDRLGAADE